MQVNEQTTEYSVPQRMGPFRRAVLRGLALLLPPLLTIVIIVWIGNTVADYLLVPLENATRWVLVEKVADIRTPTDVPPGVEGDVMIDGKIYDIDQRGAVRTVEIGNQVYRQTPPPDNKFIPAEVYEFVRRGVGRGTMPDNARDIYTWYVDRAWLPRHIVVPVFLCLFLLVLYLLGKFLAAGVGRFFWTQGERAIHRVPLVRNVYGSVKQITDFFFGETDLPYTRVVAIEYPRKGTWTLAFLTGEGMWDIRNTTGEPMVTVFVPTAPMPFTGYVLTVKKSEVVELTITIDQAIQFQVSCGVVIPPPIFGVPQKEGEKLPSPSAADRA